MIPLSSEIAIDAPSLLAWQALVDFDSYADRNLVEIEAKGKRLSERRLSTPETSPVPPTRGNGRRGPDAHREWQHEPGGHARVTGRLPTPSTAELTGTAPTPQRASREPRPRWVVDAPGVCRHPRNGTNWPPTRPSRGAATGAAAVVLRGKQESSQSMIFQKESLRLILPSVNSNRSHPRTSMCSPVDWVPRMVHSDTPRSPHVQWRSSP